jgi:hypothetical protein
MVDRACLHHSEAQAGAAPRQSSGRSYELLGDGDRTWTKDLPLRSRAVEPALTPEGRALEPAGRRV